MERGSSDRLTKAHEFYSLAYRTIPYDAATLSMSSVGSGGVGQGWNLIYLALANNLGAIHLVLRNHAETKICANEIYNRIRLLMGSPETEPSFYMHLERDDDCRIFLLNASFFLITDSLPAEAA